MEHPRVSGLDTGMSGLDILTKLGSKDTERT